MNILIDLFIVMASVVIVLGTFAAFLMCLYLIKDIWKDLF